MGLPKAVFKFAIFESGFLVQNFVEMCSVASKARQVARWTRRHCEFISYTLCRAVFLNRRFAARYRALASIIPGRERFSWN